MNNEARHMSSPVNEELYAKMSREMEQYRENLLSKSPGEILEYAYGYATREDILLSLEFHDLTDRQATALLKSEHPLEDVFMKWEGSEHSYMKTIQTMIESTANDKLREDFKEKWRKEHGER